VTEIDESPNKKSISIDVDHIELKSTIVQRMKQSPKQSVTKFKPKNLHLDSHNNSEVSKIRTDMSNPRPDRRGAYGTDMDFISEADSQRPDPSTHAKLIEAALHKKIS
jgi:hypothetical protein